MSNEPSRSRPDANRPPKTVLICPECGHESPIDGDWVRDRESSADGSQTVYTCPDCGTVISRRPLGDRLA